MSKISVSNISKAVFIPSSKCEEFKLEKKKGEKYFEINFKFPFIHRLEYKENQYIDAYWGKILNEQYSESSILKNNDIILKDGELYEKAMVKIVYLDGKERHEYYNTDELANERYEELCSMFDLKPINYKKDEQQHVI